MFFNQPFPLAEMTTNIFFAQVTGFFPTLKCITSLYSAHLDFLCKVWTVTTDITTCLKFLQKIILVLQI